MKDLHWFKAVSCTAQRNMGNIFKSWFLPNSTKSQYYACGILCLGGFLGGTVTGWSSPALPSLESSRDFEGLSITDLSWIASIPLLGTVIGSPFGGYVIQKCGRKKTLLLSSFPFAIGWIGIAFPSEIWMLYAGRFLVGVGMSLVALTTSIYLSEIAEPEIRGSLSVIFFVSIRLGILFEYGIGSFLPYNHLSLISAAVSVVFGFYLSFIPESPRWLMSKWREQDAIDSMCWLRGCDKGSPSLKILEEIQKIKKAVLKTEKETAESKISTNFRNSSILKCVLITTTLMCSKEACGGNAMSYYVVNIFEQTGSALESHLSGFVIGVAQLVGILLTTFYVDKIGRRGLLIASLLVMSSSLAFNVLFYHFKTELSETSQYFNWIPLLAFIAYHTAYSGGPSVLAWTVTSEIIPTHVMGSVSGLVTTLGWACAFVFTRYFQDMAHDIGLANTFLIYAGVSAFGAIAIFLLVPETVGKSLENIHHSKSETGTELDHVKA